MSYIVKESFLIRISFVGFFLYGEFIYYDLGFWFLVFVFLLFAGKMVYVRLFFTFHLVPGFVF